MRVVAVSNAYPPDRNTGAQLTLHELLRDLVRDGEEVTVLVLAANAGSRYRLDGVTVVPGDKRSAGFLARTADVLISHQSAVPLAARLPRRAGVPFIQLVHGDDDKSRERLRYGGTAAVFCADWLSELCPEVRLRRLVVHPPVDPTAYATSPGDRVTLVNLSEAKGVGVFYRLATAMPELGFLGVLGGHETQLVRRLPNVEIVGNTTDMRRDVYARTRVLLMPSTSESYGRVGIEAAASGIPTLAAPTPGLREALGPAAVFAELGRFEDWRHRLRELLAESRHRVQRDLAVAHATRVAERTRSELARWRALVQETAAETS